MRRAAGNRKGYIPLEWNEFFERKLEVKTQTENGKENLFNIYELGGGDNQVGADTNTVVLMLHGGGLSGLSFAVVAKEMKSRVGACRFLALDLRGHGDTSCADGGVLSREVLCQDVVSVVQTLFGSSTPRIVLMGHSLGGALAIHLSSQNMLPTVVALIVIDVVEGSAVAALPEMTRFLRSRPTQFKSLEDAIAWNVRSGQIRCLDSARVSVPKQVTKVSKDAGQEVYRWAVDLEQTEPYWPGWFDGISHEFLSTSIPKLLILAGINTLDKPLTVAQMQGKFQLQVIENVGHQVHEDAPEKVADIITLFMTRHRFAKKEGKPVAALMPAC
eukprot:m.337628 g.337628  ORF g.337628 m.337628 type:complete len:330 (-) comp18187_c0_seq1:82-1071(-)